MKIHLVAILLQENWEQENYLTTCANQSTTCKFIVYSAFYWKWQIFLQIGCSLLERLLTDTSLVPFMHPISLEDKQHTKFLAFYDTWL